MKSKTKSSTKLLALVLTAIMALSVCAAGIVPVSADTEISVIRYLPPDIVEQNEEFVVTVTQSGFDMNTGWVTETLPEDFVYVEASFTGDGIENVTYNESTRKLKFPFRDETSVTYSVKASSYDQIAEFSGRYGTVGGIGDVGGDKQVKVDETPPYTDGHNPAKGATGVPIDTNIVVHVKDNVAGVDLNTIEMTVNGVPVTLDVLPIGILDFSVTYDPPVNFGYGETVTVTIDASDLAGNAMPQDSYSFTTETGVEEGSIAGNVREVDDSILPDATVELFKDTTLIDTDTTDVNGDYTLSVSNTGDYTVTVSKSGYVSETQDISVTAVPGEYTLDFVSNDALVPEDPGFDYVLDCVWLWKGEGQISFDKILDVIFYWKS